MRNLRVLKVESMKSCAEVYAEAVKYGADVLYGSEFYRSVPGLVFVPRTHPVVLRTLIHQYHLEDRLCAVEVRVI